MTSSLPPTNLRVNDSVSPVGTAGTPYFGWTVNDPSPDQVQTRYQVIVASSRTILEAGQGDAWDSGAVASDMQNHIAYGGDIPLTSNTTYYWKVRTWNSGGHVSPYSEAGLFVTGLLQNDDWAGAVWIRTESTDRDDYGYYRRAVTLPDKRLQRATLFISAVHKYALYLNGRLIGTGPSYHYPQHQYYNAYDVTAHVSENARNVFAILNHWFGGGQGRPASVPGVILKVVVQYTDGGSDVIGTDGSWKQVRAESWVSGQARRNDEGVGYIEKIDAAKLIPNWHAATYDDSAWGPAAEIGAHPTSPWTGELYPDLSRIVERAIAPASIMRARGGAYVVDLGSVSAGRPQINFSGGRAGAVVSMRGGYRLTRAGTIDAQANQNTDMSYETMLSGVDFTFLPLEYLGMRYVQVDDPPMPITTENFAFIERHAALDGNRSDFTCSHPTLNAVWELMKRSLYLGAQEQFLDTPTREKGGFLVDAANESQAAMSAFGERVLTLKSLNEFLHSMDHYWDGSADRGRMNAVYPNGDGARDIPDFTQAYLPWVWEYYLHSGDRLFLSDHYPSFKAIADYVDRHRDGATGLIHRLTGGAGPYQYGIVDWPPSMRYGYDMAADARTVINALAYADYVIVSQIAAALGNPADSDKYRTLAEELKRAMNAQLLNAEGVYVDGLYASGAPSTHVSQHANALPLALGIVPAEKRRPVLDKVKELKMSVGMVTVGWLIRALGEMDAGEHLVDLYTQVGWDGWASNLATGATSTWESWDADTGEGLSLSHPWGAIGLCGLQYYLLGVKPLAPQYAEVQIKPLRFGAKLTSASGKVPTDRGDIIVGWSRNEGGFHMTLQLPVNVRARLYVPNTGADGPAVTVDGTGVTGLVEGDYVAIGEVGSGVHTIERGATRRP
jgi:alpha-L-rhamnosidase